MDKVKILAIDNNPDNLVVLKELMAEIFPEYPFISAQSTPKGIELCHSEKPDVIILDIALSETDNYGIFQSLKTNEATKTIPIIILTASQTDKIKRIKALEMGANAFLAYPLDESELKAQIYAMIRIKKSEDQVLNEKERLIQLVNERTAALQIELSERKQAQEALQDSEEKHSILFMNSPDSYLIIKDGLIIDCNKATEDMLGGDRSSIVGQLPAALSPEFQPDGKKSTESAKEKIDYAFKFGKNSFEWVHRRFDGSDLYVEVSIAPMLMKGKQTLFTTWRDISARKIAEQALKESESQFKEFFEKAADAIFIANIESGIIVDANEAACRLMHRTLKELVGINQSDLHPPVKENYTKETFKKHKELGRQNLSSVPLENTVVRADGIEVPVEILAAQVTFRGKQCLQGTFRDITERKKAEEAIQISEARYRYMFQHNPQPMWIYDHDTLEILEVNEISSKIYGYSREEFLSMTIKDIRPAEDVLLLLEDIEISRLNENSIGEWRHLKKNGEIMDVEISASSILFNERKARHVLIKDITERKRAEEALRKSESLLRTLIESAPFEVWARDKDGVGILENENQVRHFGSILGKTPDYKGISHQISHLWNSNNKRAMNGEIVNEECVYRIDGVDRNFHQILAPIIVNGSIEGITGFNIDITERKQAQEELRKSEAQFREFFEKAADAIFVADVETGILVDANEAACRLLLMPREMIVGKLQSMLHPETKKGQKTEIFETHKIEASKNRSTKRVINQILRSDGIIVDVEVLASEVLLNGKKCLMGTFRDISERKKAEEALRDSEYFFKESQRAAFVGSYKFDIISDYWTSSEVLEQIFGIDENYNKSFQSWLEITHPDDREMMARYFSEDVLAKRQPFNKEYRIISQSNGEIHWVLGLGKLNLDAEGNVVEMIGTIQDITERKLAEHTLKEREQLFQELFNASPDAIVLIDPHHPSVSWQILDCNAASCQLNGYTREEMIGQSIDLLNVSLGSKEERITYLNKLRRDKVIHTETCHRHKDGHIFLIEVSTSIISIGGRELILGIDRDITERKLAEDTIRLNEDRLRRAELASKSGNWEYYLDSQTMVGSVGAAKVYGIEGDRFNYDVIKNIPLPEYRSVLDTALKNLLENEIAYDIEFKIKTVDTHEIKDIHSVAFHNKEKKIVFGIIQDVTDRKQAETELIQSEDRYRRFISQISEGVYRFECDVPMDINLPLEEQIDFIYDHMYIAECNYAFQRMYGIPHEKEVIRRSFLDFHGGRDNDLNRSSLREFVNNGYRVENVMTEEINPDNGQMIYFSNNSLGIIEKNQLVRIWGTQTDITGKIKADQIQQVLFSISNAALSSIDLHKLIEFISEEVGKLLDSTNFYIAFYDEKTDMLSTIYERDEKDDFETWPAANSMTGYVVKQQKSLLLKEEDVDAFYRAAGIKAIGTPSKVWLGVPLESNKKTIGAIVVQSYDNVDAYTEKDKQMLEFISHQIGISIERKRTEQDLKLMGKAFDQSPVTIVITDKEGNIEYTNPKFSESTGYTLDEVKGKNPRLLQSGNQSKEYYQELWRTILDGKDWVGEFQNKRKNGETYWDSAVISPITNESGEIAFFLAIKEDITEKKKMIDDLVHARNKAEESDRLKSSFLANMSHEIRTPLNSIIGFSELLLDKEFGMEQHEEFARTINSSGNGLLTIISDIMDLSKIESGQVQVKKESFSVTKLMNEIQKEYSYRALEKGLELRLDPGNPNDDFFIESDEQRLRQILINFVGNAIKFTEKGFVQIGFGIESGSDKEINSDGAHGRDKACHASTMRFFVKDTGIGIPEEFHEKIFERFRQVEVSHTRKYGGNGLGLAISKNLIEMLGGEIGLESNVGKGSTFYFTIPAR